MFLEYKLEVKKVDSFHFYDFFLHTYQRDIIQISVKLGQGFRDVIKEHRQGQ